MFTRQQPTNRFMAAFVLIELIYHATVRSIRRGHGNAIVALFLNIFQTLLFVAVFWFMITYVSGRHLAIRGNFVLYLFSGVFLYMTHSKTAGAVFSAEGPASPMMLHAPMNTVIAITSAALGALYNQTLSMLVVLYGYHVLVEPLTIDDPAGFAAMLLLAWLFGIAVGMVFIAIRPWAPEAAGILQTVWSRVNMIFSGKMFVANTLQYTMLKMFDWNPLFHLIDQARGYVFLNYYPHYTSIRYPVYVILVCLTVGLMGEFFTRRRVSVSWSAGR